MNKKLIYFLAGIFSLAIFALGTYLLHHLSPQIVYATSGACSDHGGVDCAAGSSSDGSVICNDGWSGSSVQYSSADECSATPAPVITPICPTGGVVNYQLATTDFNQVPTTSAADAPIIARLQADVDAANVPVEQAKNNLQFAIASGNTVLAKQYQATLDNATIQLQLAEIPLQEIQLQAITAQMSSLKSLVDLGVLAGADLKTLQSFSEGYGIPLSVLKAAAKNQTRNCIPQNNACPEGYGYNILISACSLTEDLPTTFSTPLAAPQLPNSTSTVSQPINHQNSFSDIDSSNYKDAIIYLEQQGIVSGNGGSFRPLDPINRAEFTKIIVTALKHSPQEQTYWTNCFSDVHTEWFAPYVCFAKTAGIISGYKGGSFKPNNSITVPEALKIVLEGYGKNVPSAAGPWYQKYVNYAQNNGLMLSGWQNNLNHHVTREEMAELIYEISQ